MVLLFVLRILLAQVSVNFIQCINKFLQIIYKNQNIALGFVIVVAHFWKYINTVNLLFLQGWYIITYALGIYHLNLFIAFLTPKIDPALDYEGREIKAVLF